MFSKTVQFVSWAVIAVGLSFSGLIQAQNTAEPEPVITNITGDLYSFRQGRHLGMFLVTEEGIILVDPTNPEVAGWLKEQLDERFAVPVKYVLYSHSHNDHAGGGDVFADTAIFVGHENMRANLIRPADDAPLLAREQLWDANGDGRIQQSEAGGYTGVDTGPSGFARFDVDQNGWLSRAEIWAARFGGPTVRAPDLYYSDKLTLSLGGKSVELHYLGKNHTDDMSVILFPAERTIYTVDALIPNRLPWQSLDASYLPDWVTWLQRVEKLDFDVVVPGHESPGTKAHVAEQARYMAELYEAVSSGIAAGKSVDELVDTVLMEDYRDLIEYESSRASNVLGAYEILMSTPGQH
jgi:glyoxylase-like metal-dependent hydrolase (beta-lactamase superfamily II)